MAEEAPPAYALHRLRRLREQCRAFRESLPVEHRAGFDELLRDTSAAVKAGASNIDVTIEVRSLLPSPSRSTSGSRRSRDGSPRWNGRGEVNRGEDGGAAGLFRACQNTLKWTSELQ